MAILNLRPEPEGSLFDRLHLGTGATEEEIWFAYLMKVHKRLGNVMDVQNVQDAEVGLGLVGADHTIEELTEAYQVLSDPETKKAYVRYGTRPEPDSLVHYSVILQMVFGSERFRNYVGTMRLDSLAAAIETATDLSDDEMMKEVLKKDEDLLKVKVKECVRFMDRILGHSSKHSMRRALAEDPGFSVYQFLQLNPRALDMLKTIGPIYKSNAAKLGLIRDQEQADSQGSRTYQKDGTLWEVCRTVFGNLTDKEKKKRAKKLQKFGELLEKMEERSGRTTLVNFFLCGRSF